MANIMHTIILSRVSCIQCDILWRISELGYYITYGYWMAICRTLTSTQAVPCYLKHWLRSHGNGSFII
jgi:hypothetical protein